jgi:hypothetical protein
VDFQIYDTYALRQTLMADLEKSGPIFVAIINEKQTDKDKNRKLVQNLLKNVKVQHGVSLKITT